MTESQDTSDLIITSAWGGRYYAKKSEAHHFYAEPLVMKFLGLCALIVIMYRSDTYLIEIQDVVSSNIAFIMHALSALIILTGMVLIFVCYIKLCARGYLKTVYLPFVTIPTALSVQVVTACIVRVITAQWPEQIISVEEFLKDAVVVIAFETMFVLYVVPVSRTFRNEHGSYGPAQAPQPAEESYGAPLNIESASPSTKSIAEQEELATEPYTNSDSPVFFSKIRSFTAQEIEYVQSRGHYLHFYHEGRETTIRGNLRTVAEQLGQKGGVQVNRSVWVSFYAVKAITQTNGKSYVDLHSGHQERISEARKLAVSLAYQAFQSAVAESKAVSADDGQENIEN